MILNEEKIVLLSEDNLKDKNIAFHHEQIDKTNTLFKQILEQIKNKKKIVISISGGSGSGKSSTALLLQHIFNINNVSTIIVNGDNYPRRIPTYNDAERLSIFRKFALKNMVIQGEYSKERFEIIQKIQLKNDDANAKYLSEHPWFKYYLGGGRQGLSSYLGKSPEQDFDEANEMLLNFKNGNNNIFVKHMGNDETSLWYDEVNVSAVDVLILEWTHSNSDEMKNIDVSVYLDSSFEQTESRRRERNRRAEEIDNPFIELVLSVEQDLLYSQVKNAKIILSYEGEILSYEEFKKLREV